uniref:Uncharacterized protein n=1 Tax=Callorhinchus milii TaxID=7868 RepID=A0A4W3H7F1_CALMI
MCNWLLRSPTNIQSIHFTVCSVKRFGTILKSTHSVITRIIIPCYSSDLYKIDMTPFIFFAGIPVTTISVPIISHFHAGSFIGGIVLAFALVGIFYFGRKFCISRSGTRYRTIEETEAII